MTTWQLIGVGAGCYLGSSALVMVCCARIGSRLNRHRMLPLDMLRPSVMSHETVSEDRIAA